MMKKLILILVPALLILGMNACEKNSDRQGINGEIKFVIGMENAGLKAALTDSIPQGSYQVLVTVKDQNGATLFDNKLIPVYRFGDGFVSEKINIQSGALQLTKFMVIDPAGNVVYASPVKGSAKAFLVNEALPLSFRIVTGELTSLSPEVLPVNGASASDFGYVSFGMQIVNPLPVYVVVMLNDPRIEAPTQITDAMLNVTSDEGWMHAYSLERKINKILIRGGSPTYRFEVMKDGYSPAKFYFTEEELQKTTEANPLVLTIPWEPMESVIIRPGPDAGKDAMISDLDPDKNFGSWPYFEATFLSESPLTVMRTNRSLIYFNMDAVPKSARIEKVLLTLKFDKPLGWDSLRYDVIWYGAVFQKIMEPWDENTVTWNNQPATTEVNQVYVTPHPELSTNMRTYDVTSLYAATAEMESPDYGFMFRLYPTPQFAGFRFGSSDFGQDYMRPELKVYFSYLPD